MEQSYTLSRPETTEITAALVTRINEAHAKCESAVTAALDHAMEVGRLLIEVKQQIGHGGFIDWITAHCKFSVRTAQGYMRIARNGAAIESKAQPVSHLGVKAALKLLAEDRADDGDVPAGGSGWPRYTRYLDMSPEQRRQLTTKWFDQQAKYVVLLDAAGWSPATIAESMGQGGESVRAILRHEPPVRFDTQINGSGILPDAQVQTYRAYVEHTTLAMLRLDYVNAIACAEYEGFPEAVPDLEAELRRIERRLRDLHENDIDRFSKPIADGHDDSVALLACALTDARVSLGIEPPKVFLPMFIELREVVKAGEIKIVKGGR